MVKYAAISKQEKSSQSKAKAQSLGVPNILIPFTDFKLETACLVFYIISFELCL